jgi:hypothetical protein
VKPSPSGPSVQDEGNAVTLSTENIIFNLTVKSASFRLMY